MFRLVLLALPAALLASNGLASVPGTDSCTEASESPQASPSGCCGDACEDACVSAPSIPTNHDQVTLLQSALRVDPSTEASVIEAEQAAQNRFVPVPEDAPASIWILND